jgi:hypothetical protein
MSGLEVWIYAFQTGKCLSQMGMGETVVCEKDGSRATQHSSNLIRKA